MKLILRPILNFFKNRESNLSVFKELNRLGRLDSESYFQDYHCDLNPAKEVAKERSVDLFRYISQNSKITGQDYIRRGFLPLLLRNEEKKLAAELLGLPEVTSELLLETRTLDSCLESFRCSVDSDYRKFDVVESAPGPKGEENARSVFKLDLSMCRMKEIEPLQALLAAGKFSRAHFIHDGRNLCQMISSMDRVDLLSDLLQFLVAKGYCFPEDFISPVDVKAFQAPPL